MIRVIYTDSVSSFGIPGVTVEDSTDKFNILRPFRVTGVCSCVNCDKTATILNEVDNCTALFSSFKCLLKLCCVVEN